MASVRRRGESWRVVWRDETRVQQSRTFKRKTDATAFAATIEADKVRGVGVDPAGGRVTFNTYAAEWQNRQVWAETTQRTFRHNLSNLPFGAKTVAAVRHRDIQAWIADLSTRLKPSTVEARYRAVVAVFRAAKRDRLVQELPTDDVRLPRDDRTPEERAVALDQATIHALLDALPAGSWADFARFMLLTGLRPSEAAGVTVDRIQGGRLTVDRQLREGSGYGPVKTPASVRAIPLSATALEVVERQGVTEGPLFVSRHGGALSKGARVSAWHRARGVLAESATPLPTGARGWHTLRHTFASTALAAGMDAATLSRYLGHATVAETLTTYSHMLPGALDAHRDTVAGALNLG